MVKLDVDNKTEIIKIPRGSEQEIQALVNRIENIPPSNPLYSHRKELAQDLSDHLHGIGLSQGASSSDCTASSIMNVLLTKDPIRYARIATSLIENGTAEKGKLQFIKSSEIPDSSMLDEQGVKGRRLLTKILNASVMELINGEDFKFNPLRGASQKVNKNSRLPDEVYGGFDSQVERAVNLLLGRSELVYVSGETAKYLKERIIKDPKGISLSITLDPAIGATHQTTIVDKSGDLLIIKDSQLPKELPDVLKNKGAVIVDYEKGLWAINVDRLLEEDNGQGALARYVVLSGGTPKLNEMNDQSIRFCLDMTKHLLEQGYESQVWHVHNMYEYIMQESALLIRKQKESKANYLDIYTKLISLDKVSSRFQGANSN